MASVDTLADTLEAVEVETLGNQKGDVGGLDTARSSGCHATMGKAATLMNTLGDVQGKGLVNTLADSIEEEEAETNCNVNAEAMVDTPAVTLGKAEIETLCHTHVKLEVLVDTLAEMVQEHGPDTCRKNSQCGNRSTY